MTALETKLKKLDQRLRGLDSVLVAYSGGVDSSFLLKAARRALGGKVLAVTALSETYPRREIAAARLFASELGAKFNTIRTSEIKNPRFRSNPPDRCYFCKKELFAELKKLARAKGLNAVIDGSNVDDLADYRPGARAKKEFGVISPLQEAGLTKKEIRLASRRWGIASWDKPALACLASRIPYHSEISRARLVKIDAAEEALRRAFNIKGNLRVRDLGSVARVEVDPKEIGKLKRRGPRLAGLMEQCGYRRVAVDPKGYRTGSLNEGIKR